MNFDFLAKLYVLPAILLGLVVHEFMHAAAANALGDPTAKEEGRLTLNPLRHLDLMGCVFILLAGFGWAKPVSFDRSRLKKPRRDEALIALAGPLSNLVLAVLACFAYLALRHAIADSASPHSAGTFLNGLTVVLVYMILINLGLFIFNLLPLPPLDGFHVLAFWLNLKPETEQKLYRFGMPALFLILLFEWSTKIYILPIGQWSEGLANLILRALS